ncbi:hypothetical protein BGW38_008937 [Lunasporangiospora selenospora]|uniref:Mitochondrial carrier protein n=1 Tax=Lunasporangiospora selenospora TaxID=979761 RepID=A0A9P6FXI5_9FUNG|nr:hypothetical protein BGW38_008937 [Lunasporangiospora selenospora]
MSAMTNPVTTALVENPVPPEAGPQRKVTLGPGNVLAYMVQGTGAFMCLDVISWPLEVARTRMQATKDNTRQSTFRLLRDIARTEGPSKLFRGLGPFMLTSLPSQAVYLGVYEHATSVIENSFPDPHSSNSAVREIAVAGSAGFLAEMLSACLYVPTEIISQRLRVQAELKGGKHYNSFDICKLIYRTDGFGGFYRGFVATLLTYTPSSVTHWAGYESTKKMLYNHFSAKEMAQIQEGNPNGFYARNRLSQSSIFIVGLSALNASALSLVTSSPFDMVRVRLQLLDSTNQQQAEQLKRGWWSMAKLIAKEEGARGFFKGMGPKIIASIPLGIGYLFAYEQIKVNLVSDSSTTSSVSLSSTSTSSTTTSMTA